MLPEEQRLRFAIQCAASELAGRLQAFKGTGLIGQAGDDQQGLGARSDPQVEAIAGFLHLARVQAGEHGAVRQRAPVRCGRRKRQEHQGAGVGREARRAHPGADLAYGHEQLVNG